MTRQPTISALCLIMALAGCASDPIVPPEPDEFETLDDEFNYRVPRLLEEHGVPGAAVGLIVDGEIVFRRGFGFANVESERPTSSGTVFNVGAMSTMFVGWGTLRLNLDQRLFEDLPVEGQITQWQFPPSSFNHAEITIARLLRHTGGTSIASYNGYPFGQPIPSVVEVLNGDAEDVEGVQVVYQPATQVRYSSGGFAVIQLAILETVAETDVTFEGFMLGSVLLPLGMESSDFRFPPAITTGLATPYDEQGQELVVRRFAAMAASGLMTTVDDLLAYADQMIKVAQGEPFTALGGFTRPTLEGMRGQAVGEGPEYVRGHQVRRVGSLVTFGHGGAGSGWRTHFQVDPFSRQAIVVLTNSDLGEGIIDPLVCRWYEEMAGADPAEFCSAN